MQRQVERAPSVGIDPRTTIGVVSLTVSDLARSQAFYEQVLGLRAAQLPDGALGFGADDDRPLVVLYGDASAPRLDRRATGLFHLAILVPARIDLGFALDRIAAAQWPLDGASDHLVSEALYLSDPDGNGIEIYRDRPREKWRRSGTELQMATLPLDLDDLLAEVRDAPELQRQAPVGTTIGHVHLQVADLRASEAFYHGVLGFDVTVRTYPGALFVSAGGYHHHIGLNTWHTVGGRPPEPGAIGLRSFELLVSDQAELERVVARVRAHGLEVELVDRGGSLVRDPSGIAVVLRSR